MQIRQKKNNKAGFSLTELLAAILILAMVVPTAYSLIAALVG